MEEKEVRGEAKTTLRDDDITTERTLDRRGAIAALGTVVAVVVLGAVSLVPGEAAAAGASDDGPREGGAAGTEGEPNVIAGGCTDSDGGRFADPPGRGRRCYRRIRRRCTDSDGGRFADPPGRGRRC